MRLVSLAVMCVLYTGQPSGNSSYALYDQGGRLVMNEAMHDNSTSIDIRHLSPGVYFMHTNQLYARPLKIVKN